MGASTGSLFWLGLVMRKRFPDATSKLLMLALADHVDEHDMCYPSVKLLAAEAMCSERTARRHLQTLHVELLVQRGRMRREDGTLGVYRYRLNRDAVAALDDCLPANLAAGAEQDERALHLVGTSGHTSGHSCGRAEPPNVEPPNFRADNLAAGSERDDGTFWVEVS